MNYSSKVWSGKHFSEIFSEVLHANNTINKNLVRVIDNVKDEIQLTTISGGIPLQAYHVNPAASTSGVADTITFSDATVKPVKKMAHTRFDMNTLVSSRFSLDMKSGAANIESDEFLRTVLAYVVPQIGLSYEQNIWSLLVSKLDAAGTATEITGTTLTPSNVVAEFTKIYQAMPAQVKAHKDAKIYADHAQLSNIKLANLNATYRDIFEVVGDEVKFLGIKVEFVPMPTANTLVAGIATDFVVGCDLLSDLAAYEVGKVNNEGDLLFFKAVMSLDADVVIKTQKVLYKA